MYCFLKFILVIPLICLLFLRLESVSGQSCTLDNDREGKSKFIKTLFAIDGGHNTDIDITAQRFKRESRATGNIGGTGAGGSTITSRLEGLCSEIISYKLNDSRQVAALNINIMYKNDSTARESYFCVKLYWQTVNIIQYKVSNIITDTIERARQGCKDFDQYQAWSNPTVGFNKAREFYNCKTIMEGVFRFTYQLHEAQKSECDSLSNKITSCQRAGSHLRDNNIMKITFGTCPGIGTGIFSKQIQQDYYCLGSWKDSNNNIYAAISGDEADVKFKYRCLLTRKDQNEKTMIYRWGMTVDGDCTTLKSPYDSPLKLVLTPSLDDTEQIPYLTPGCNLPKNFTGTWFYPTEYQTDVYINATTIKMRRQLDQFHWEEVYFVCQQARENRYLMAVVTKGKCDVDYMCFNFMPRHHNIIRFRMARPVKRVTREKNTKGDRYMIDIFRESCHWSSFTLNEIDWVYEYLVLNPPVPITCPIQGRFNFNMKGQKDENYYFKIPGGVTLRPRIQVNCPQMYNESDIHSCQDDDKHLLLDVSRCMRLDHLGRPLSEYDFPDNILTCVGYWMEDAKSYLVTYDPDDPVVGNFRCWVYRRTGLRTIRMSRSRASKCMPKVQVSSSSTPKNGASLLLELTENERIFDYCPIRFDDGRDPYANNYNIDVYAAASSTSHSVLLVTSTFLLHYLGFFSS